MNPDYFIIPLIMGQVTHIITALKTGYVLLDCCLFGLLYLLYQNVNIRNLTRRFYALFKKNQNKQTVVLMSYEEKRSIKFRAIMHYLAQQNKTIYKIREVNDRIWDDEECRKLEKNSEYLVDQSKEFALTPHIFGLITINSKEKMRGFSATEYIEYNILKLYSYTLTLTDLQEWINGIVKAYKQHLKTASNETQLYITASTAAGGKKRNSDSSNSSLYIEAVPWESTITFANSYFHEMEGVLKKIDFFLKNKAWYQEKGIPYNLGILLYGEPGCGKTRFIKQLLNHTGRHGIDIKLNDQMNFQDLYSIIFKEEINEDYIIPQEQRILIFEDIDAMGEAVKCRDTKTKEIKKKKEEEYVKVDMLQELIKEEKKEGANGIVMGANGIVMGTNVMGTNVMGTNVMGTSNNNQNNLSYLLNMFDGINECSGRIIIMTSNKPEVLDKALIRPGRIDIKIHFKNCSTYDVMRLINLFWDLDVTEAMLLPELDMKHTSAEIYNIFRSTNDFQEIKALFIQKT
jgi:ATP-dependent 26S proteasome regulatory subunit